MEVVVFKNHFFLIEVFHKYMQSQSVHHILVDGGSNIVGPVFFDILFNKYLKIYSKTIFLLLPIGRSDYLSLSFHKNVHRQSNDFSLKKVNSWYYNLPRVSPLRPRLSVSREIMSLKLIFPRLTSFPSFNINSTCWFLFGASHITFLLSVFSCI